MDAESRYRQGFQTSEKVFKSFFIWKAQTRKKILWISQFFCNASKHPTQPASRSAREGIKWAAAGGITCRASPTLPHTGQFQEIYRVFVYRKKNAESENVEKWLKASRIA